MAKETDNRVFVAFVTDEGRVLVVKRSWRTNNPGQVGLPGGHANEGESYEETARREVREEIGVDFDFTCASYAKIHADPKRVILITAMPSHNGWNLHLDPEEVESVTTLNAVQLASLSDHVMHTSLKLAHTHLLNMGLRTLWEMLVG